MYTNIENLKGDACLQASECIDILVRLSNARGVKGSLSKPVLKRMFRISTELLSALGVLVELA